MKFLKIAGISALVVLALAMLGVSLVFAQRPGPNDSPWWDAMRERMQQRGGPGYGMMGGAFDDGDWEYMQQMHEQMGQNGGFGAMQAWMHQSGGVHEAVWSALAEKLGLSSDELASQLESGKTLAQVAQDQGVSASELAATMETSMKAGLAQAVDDGVMSQEQADWMLENMADHYEWMIDNMGAGMFGSGGSWRRDGGTWGPGGCHNNYQDSDDNTSF